MKKAYGKPTISFESFAFSSNIAGNCAKLNGLLAAGTCNTFGTHGDPITCDFYSNNYQVFYQGDCLVYAQENKIGNLCYHVSTDETRMFAS